VLTRWSTEEHSLITQLNPLTKEDYDTWLWVINEEVLSHSHDDISSEATELFHSMRTHET